MRTEKQRGGEPRETEKWILPGCFLVGMIITILFCEVCAQFLGASYRITGCYIYSLLLLSSEHHPGYILREITIASSVSDAANKIIRTLVRERDVSVQILSQLVCQDSGDKSKWVYLISCQCPPPPQYTHAPSASCDISYIFISTIKRFTLEQPQGEIQVRFTANLVVAYNKKWRKPIYVTTMVSFSRTMFGTRSHTRSLTITQQQVNHHRTFIEYIYRYIFLVIPPHPPPFWDGSQSVYSMVEY